VSFLDRAVASIVVEGGVIEGYCLPARRLPNNDNYQTKPHHRVHLELWVHPKTGPPALLAQLKRIFLVSTIPFHGTIAARANYG
jgi:hypothetical protein